MLHEAASPTDPLRSTDEEKEESGLTAQHDEEADEQMPEEDTTIDDEDTDEDEGSRQ